MPVKDDEADDSLAATGDARLPRLSNDALHERVYRELRDALSEGRFLSGETVTIRGLADMLGTSPMPVREAVRRLVQDRSLEMMPNRTMRVPLMSQRRFDELTDVRAELEGHAAFRACERFSEDQFTAIRAANERMSVAIHRLDVQGVVTANKEFHFEVYRAADSEVLLSIIEAQWQQSGPYLAVLLKALSATPSALLTVGYGHHFELLAAFSNRDPQAARRAMSADIIEAAAWYRENAVGPAPEQSATAQSRQQRGARS